MANLADILSNKGGDSKPPPAKPSKPPEPAPAAQEAPQVAPQAIDGILDHIEGIEVEAVVGGALQRIRLRAGTNPALVAALLKTLDPGAEVRSAFPARGNFGSRETKTARVLVIQARVTDGGAFIDLIGRNGADLSVSVSKKSAAGFLDAVKALGKLSDTHLQTLDKAWADKAQATIILPESEQFGVQYWTTDDGKAFMDSLVAEPPAAQPETGGDSNNAE